MKLKTVAIILFSCLPIMATAFPPTLCNSFNPAHNKSFTDTLSLNFLTISRSGISKINGQFTHNFGGNKILSATVTGTCITNRISISWQVGKTFYGGLSGTLVCQNGVYNIVNVIASVNNRDPLILAMISPVTGNRQCP